MNIICYSFYLLDLLMGFMIHELPIFHPNHQQLPIIWVHIMHGFHMWLCISHVYEGHQTRRAPPHSPLPIPIEKWDNTGCTICRESMSFVCWGKRRGRGRALEGGGVEGEVKASRKMSRYQGAPPPLRNGTIRVAPFVENQWVLFVGGKGGGGAER